MDKLDGIFEVAKESLNILSSRVEDVSNPPWIARSPSGKVPSIDMTGMSVVASSELPRSIPEPASDRSSRSAPSLLRLHDVT